MITITAGATNSFTLRLNDNVTIQNPIYLFEMQSVQSKQKFYFTAQDTSTTTRYNQFTIYESNSATQSLALTASTPIIRLSYGGIYNYRVYQTNSYDLQPTSVILDYGKMLFQNGEYTTYAFNG